MAGPPSSPPGQQVDQGIELVDGLGNGGQPEGLPRELVIADARFLFDRIVPLSRQELFRVAQEQETIAYARTEEGPFAAIYLSVPNRSEDELARYLPEGVGSADVACPAEAGDYERVDASGSLYAFAGIETDLTADSLQQVGDSNGEPVSADPDSAQPFPELFFSSGDGLLRFVLVGDDGRPASIAESLAFNGTEFAFESDATDAVDPASLTKVGCSTAFPVFAPTDTVGGGFTQLYVLAGTRLLSFTGAGAAPAEETDPGHHEHDIDDHHDNDDHDHHDDARPTPTTEPPTTEPPTTEPPTTEPPTTTDIHDDDGTADDHLDVDDHDDDGTADDHLDVDDNDDDGTADDHLDVDDDDGTADDHLDVTRPRRSRRRRPRRPPPPRPPTTTLDVDHDVNAPRRSRRRRRPPTTTEPSDTTTTTVQRQPGRAQRAGHPGEPADPDPVRWRRLCLCPG